MSVTQLSTMNASGYNETFSIIDHKNERQANRCYFEASAKQKGSHRSMFHGRISSRYQNPQKVVVKAYHQKHGYALLEECKSEANKYKVAKTIISVFLSLMQQKLCPACLVEVAKIYRAEVDVVAKFTKLIKSKTKVLKGEWVIIEERLTGKLDEIITPEGIANRFADPDGFFAAMAHASFHFSKGRHVISGMKGTVENDAHGEKLYKLTSLTVHSIEKKFGMKDCGEEGIKTFFHNHKCSNLCRDFLTYGETFQPLTVPNSTTDSHFPLKPSAPCSDEDEANANQFQTTGSERLLAFGNYPDDNGNFCWPQKSGMIQNSLQIFENVDSRWYLVQNLPPPYSIYDPPPPYE